MINKLLYIIATIGAVGAIIYIIALIYLFFNQSKMVFIPTADIEATPAEAGLEYKEFNIPTPDNITINGWYIPAVNNRATVLFCHGNGGNIGHRIETVDLLHRLGLSVIIFDYRGYGQSGGRATEQGTYTDARTIYDYAVNQLNIDPDSLIIMGRSLGGAVAAHLATEKKARGLILESTFTSAGDIGSELFPYFPVKLILKFKYNTADIINRIAAPKLIVHSVDDEMIPYHHGQKLYDNASEPKTMLTIKGAHNDGFLVSGQKYIDGLNSFIEDIL